MKNLTKQIEDWRKVKKLCDNIRKGEKTFQIDIQEFHKAVRFYYFTHKDKFDYNNEPK